MEITRRTFGKIMIGATVAALVGIWNAARECGPVRFVRAIRGRGFPGKLRPLDDATVRKQAEWRG